ncbi:hypothetical protein TWF703_006141 [Orbilia oligospora]|uniref:Condensation domain-containing protein n=1 Tax=Orbilia oligospora TaxID=2813651 RepID=A0A7C8JNE9_ORBOL|nr:hypothetical protein TWF703_006141 [Orbilia oligospora]
MSASKISWREISAGKWARDFDPIEKTQNHLSLASPSMLQLAITVGATLPESEVIGDIKDAWIGLRYAHPMIGCTITTTGLEYEVPNAEELQKWADETVIYDNSGRSGKDLLLEKVSANAPAARLFFMPHRREIVIVLRHDMTDGMGSLILLNRLIKILRQEKDVPRFGDEPTRLTPSLSEIMHAENPSIDATKEAHLVKENFTKLRAMSLKTNPNQSNMLGNLPNYVHEFSEEETSTILKACKERGITIINVSNAAMAKTLLELSGEESGRFCSIGAVNLRDVLPAPYNTPERGVGNLSIPTFPAFPVTTSSNFLELARRVEGLHSYWKYKKNAIECIGALPELVEEGFTTAVKNGITVPSIVAVISLGIIEKYLSEPVQDFLFNVRFAMSTCAMYVYTSGSRLKFLLCYNSGFHEKQSIKVLVDTAVRHVYQGLALDR